MHFAIQAFQIQNFNQKETPMIFEFPTLTGSYSVGSTTHYFIDEHREEPHNPGSKRELMTYIWYPAQSKEKNPLIPYQSKETPQVKERFKRIGFPESELNELDHIKCHATPNAPLLKSESYPVIIFSHGFAGTIPELYTAYCEELASHGYVVVSIAHTYYAAIVTMPDGREIKANPNNFAAEQAKNEGGIAHWHQELWVDDVKFILDQLNIINNNAQDFFFKSLDLNRIGIIGHSFGGSTAFLACLKDARLKAGINIDAAIYGKDDVAISDLKKPFMFMIADGTLKYYDIAIEELAKKVNQPIELLTFDRKRFYENIYQARATFDKNIQVVVIPNIEHGGFSDYMLIKDMPLFARNKQIINFDQICGTADGFKTTELVNNYFIQFFDTHLK